MERNIHAVDYVIFAIVFVGALAIGIYYAIAKGINKTTTDYLVADHHLHWFPVSLSIVASSYSAVTLLGHSAEVYNYGGIAWLTVSGNALGLILVAMVFIPVFHPLMLTSINEVNFLDLC